MEGKKVALVVGLFVIAMAFVVIMGKRAGLLGGGPRPPQWVLEQPAEKIDMKSLKLMKLSIRQWEKLGHDASGRYKNPSTGEYTMAEVMICAVCGEYIPMPEFPTAAAPKGPRERGAQSGEIGKIREEYKCPKCGKAAFSAGPLR